MVIISGADETTYGAQERILPSLYSNHHEIIWIEEDLSSDQTTASMSRSARQEMLSPYEYSYGT